MTEQRKIYDPERDFTRVRDFLIETVPAFEQTFNWRIERWNYARFFVVPMMSVPDGVFPGIEESNAGIRLWESTVGLWENEQQEVVGVASLEDPKLGHVFFQRHPDYLYLLDEMMDYAESTLAEPESGHLEMHVYDDDKQLGELAKQRGFVADLSYTDHDAAFLVNDVAEPVLPDGFAIRSMAEVDDIDGRREVFGRGFNHADPAEWPTAFSYQELQRAPDYRREQDFYVVEPNGDYASCCIIWHDLLNRIAILEPVGTPPAYRRMG
jgi:hypothetical protein